MRVVILCGGSGTRLWPESRESLPKQFIPLFKEKSLFELTLERVLSLSLSSKLIVICNKKHGFLIRNALKKYKINADIFLEPVGKNTCAAIYMAAKHCRNNEDLLIMPSDHFIPDAQKFNKEISYIKKNFSPDHWFTLGIKPQKPSEAYGYIKVKNSGKNFKKVTKFIEKPKKSIAEKIFKDENYFWNAGIFIANSSMILRSIRQFSPEIADHCDNNYSKIKINENTNEYNFCLDLFLQIPSSSIDYAVMEHEKNIFLHPFKSDWNDVGSWDSISNLHNIETIDKKIVEIDSKNNFIKNDKRIIATIGVEDLIIVNSDNATLISKKNHSEKVKKVVNKLLENNITGGKEHTFEYRPWGKFENLYENESCKVKRITIQPQSRLSLQYHNFRSEHWLIVNGTANIFLDGKHMILLPSQSIDIPIKSHHYIENKNDKDLIIIETQLGSYFGEDDIIRLDDPYNR